MLHKNGITKIHILLWRFLYMKKTTIFALALVITAVFSVNAFAKNGLSVGLGFGIKGDMNQLGGTITDDGLDGGEAQLLWGAAIIDEKTLLSLEKATIIGGNPTGSPVIDSVDTNGAMSGLDFALDVRYDILNRFFAKVGFNYTMKIAGGESSWKYTAAGAVAVSSGIALEAAGGDPVNNSVIFNAVNGNIFANVLGYKASQTWESSAWAIPIVLGINIPVLNGKANIWAGIGVAVTYGKWSVQIETLDCLFGEYSPGTAADTSTEKVEFSFLGVAPMYTLGLDAEVAMGIHVFLEWEVVLGMGYSDVQSVNTTVGQSALGLNSITYPVVTGGQIMRIGVRYSIPGTASI